MIYSWVNKVIRQNMRNRVEEIYAFMDQPVMYQEQLLRDLLAKGVETEYGHKYRFDLIHNPQEFSTRVPLSNYAALKPYIERMREGEKSVLWPGKVQWYAKSSGTTSGVSNTSLYQKKVLRTVTSPVADLNWPSIAMRFLRRKSLKA